MQISCRDYNRIAIQGNVLGAAALGVGNVLCLTGDGVQCGDHPGGQAGLRSRFDLAALDHPRDARREPVPVGPQTDHAAARLSRRGREPVRAAARFPRDQARQEDRRRRAVRPDPILLRPAAAEALHGARRATWASTSAASFWSASARSPPPGRRAGCAPTSPGVHIPDAVDRAARRRGRSAGGGQAHLHRDDPGLARGAGRRRGPRDGLSAGAEGRRDRPRVRASCAAARRGGAISFRRCSRSRAWRR